MNKEFDTRIDEVLKRIGRLIREHGVFHAKVHFSSGQVTLWSIRDPYDYRVCYAPEFLGKGFPSEFGMVTYPINAKVPPHKISAILTAFKRLRLTGRGGQFSAGSLNIINGRVGLNYSNDRSHYLDYREFLRDELFGQRRCVN